ncbi:MAG: hypothetical protein KHY24_02345, partial [Clostridiales bacterium]|nr:hypothetical protein [Clostridiales bacterium]
PWPWSPRRRSGRRSCPYNGCSSDLYNGGPVGLETISAAVGEESVTIEDVYEPYLMQIGFLARTPRGRVVTPAGYEHMGIKPNSNDDINEQQTFDL